MSTAPPMFPPTSTTELSGTVRSILWSNWGECAADPEANTQGVVIVKVATPGGDQIAKGPCPEDGIEVGMACRFLGRTIEHHQYGKQFAFNTFCRLEPATRTGVIRYLVKLAPNIGEVKACKLWDRFQSDAVRTLRETPAAVAESGILTLDQAEEAARELAKFGALEQTRIDLFGLFEKRGFPGKLIEACIAKWGARAYSRIKANPYALLVGKPRLPGCGWKRTDKLYLDLGGDAARLKRQMLAAWNALREDSSGHTFLPLGVAREAIRKAVSEGSCDVERALKLGVRAKWLSLYTDTYGQTWIAESSKAKNERIVAEKITELMG